MLILGIDDAGRGPVIGPMILAGCLLDDKFESELKRLGVKDSKQVTQKRREFLAEKIKEKAETFEVAIAYPSEIDGKNHDGINLNTLEAIKAAEIINKIKKDTPGIDKIKVIVDCPSPNIEKWKSVLKSYVEDISNLEFVVEHKADFNHIACSAASIIAKSTREKEIKKIKKQIGKDFGSGYPSDPITKKFLEDYSEEHEKDGIFRQTWQTWKNNTAKKQQKNLGDY